MSKIQNYFKIRMLILIIFVIYLPFTYGQVTIDNYIKFANEMKDKGEYYRAITEYYRVNSYFPDNEHKFENLINIADCYGLSEHYLEAIDIYKSVLEINPNNWQAVFKTSKAYFELNYYYENIDFTHSKEILFGEAETDTLKFMRSISLAALEKFDDSKTTLSTISTSDLIEKRDFNINLLDNKTPLNLKSRTTSVFLNILTPGAGYFYSSRNSTAFSALILNSLLIYSTYQAFENDQNSLGVLSGLFSLGFYMGSIYGSIQAVDNHNKEIKLNLIYQFKKI